MKLLSVKEIAYDYPLVSSSHFNRIVVELAKTKIVVVQQVEVNGHTTKLPKLDKVHKANLNHVSFMNF